MEDIATAKYYKEVVGKNVYINMVLLNSMTHETLH